MNTQIIIYLYYVPGYMHIYGFKCKKKKKKTFSSCSTMERVSSILVTSTSCSFQDNWITNLQNMVALPSVLMSTTRKQGSNLASSPLLAFPNTFMGRVKTLLFSTRSIQSRNVKLLVTDVIWTGSKDNPVHLFHN